MTLEAKEKQILILMRETETIKSGSFSFGFFTGIKKAATTSVRICYRPPATSPAFGFLQLFLTTSYRQWFVWTRQAAKSLILCYIDESEQISKLLAWRWMTDDTGLDYGHS